MRISPWAALLMLAACGRGGGEIRAQGYIEGEYINVSPQVMGRIETVLVKEGDRVQAGAPLVQLDPLEAAALRDQARAQLAASQANLDDAEAALRAAEPEFHRQEKLVARKISAQVALDTARQAYESSTARVDSAKRSIEAARGALAQADWQLAQRFLPAPATGVVDEIYYRAGEVATAGRPVLSILPAENRKVRFFIRQADLPRVAFGMQILIDCEGCGAGIPARVTYISNEAEFTPPVIYSLETRDKLVFKIEAKPVDRDAPLRIGQPVEIVMPEARP